MQLFLPLAPLVLILLFVALSVVVTLIEFGLMGYAYERLGLSARTVFWLLVLSLIGSTVNIPLFQLPPEHVYSNLIVYDNGIPYVVPHMAHYMGTIVAINVGGAVVPICLSLYLLLKHRVFFRALLATIVVTLVVHVLAHPVAGVGIAVPLFIPPVVTAIAAWIFGGDRQAPVAYIAGSLGTLIGADVMNLGNIQGLGAPVASIGGAGTFDGVFLTGLVALLLVHRQVPQRAARRYWATAQ